MSDANRRVTTIRGAFPAYYNGRPAQVYRDRFSPTEALRHRSRRHHARA